MPNPWLVDICQCKATEVRVSWLAEGHKRHRRGAAPWRSSEPREAAVNQESLI